MNASSTQLVVLGPHRSGTSAVTGLLARMGAYLGPPELDLPLHPMNPKGFGERQDVVGLNDELAGAESHSLWTAMRAEDLDAATRAAFEVRARPIVADLAAHPLGVVKDPRLCLTFALWRPLLPRPVCVIVLRNPLEVAQSLQARDGCPIHVGLAVWEHHMREALRSSAGLPRIVAAYADLVVDPHGAPVRLCAALEACGVAGLDPAKAGDWIEPGLRHHESDRGRLEELANPQQLALFRAVQDGDALQQDLVAPLSKAAAQALADQRAAERPVLQCLRELEQLRARAQRQEFELERYRGRDMEAAHLRQAVRALLASWRWRLGNGAVDLVRAALLRPGVPEPKDTILRILEHLDRDPPNPAA